MLITDKEVIKKHAACDRKWQGIPTAARAFPRHTIAASEVLIRAFISDASNWEIYCL